MGKQFDIFISHSSADRKVARALQRSIEEDFNTLSVFVSSDGRSIDAGEWFKQVKGALESSKVAIVLCSPQAAQSAWVAFEAGAAWAAKGVKVALLCHSHMSPSGVPAPFKQLQAVEVDLKGVGWLYEQITERFKSIRRPPSQDRVDAAVRSLSLAETEVIVERGLCARVNAVMALGYRDDKKGVREYLLVQTGGGDKWTFPKGSLNMVSDIADYQRHARKELLEESGAAGEVFESYFDPFEYVKSDGSRRWVLAFAARVDKMGIASESSRHPRWCSHAQARALLGQGRDPSECVGLYLALDFVAAFAERRS